MITTAPSKHPGLVPLSCLKSGRTGPWALHPSNSVVSQWRAPHSPIPTVVWPSSAGDSTGKTGGRGDSPLDPAPTELLAAAAHPFGQLGWGHPEGSETAPGAGFCWEKRHRTLTRGVQRKLHWEVSLNGELGAPQDTLVAPGAQLNGLRPWRMEDREERREARGWMPRTGPGTSSLSGHCWQESRRGHTRPTPRHRATAAQRSG